jgi:hypothetical protein
MVLAWTLFGGIFLILSYVNAVTVSNRVTDEPFKLLRLVEPAIGGIVRRGQELQIKFEHNSLNNPVPPAPFHIKFCWNTGVALVNQQDGFAGTLDPASAFGEPSCSLIVRLPVTQFKSLDYGPLALVVGNAR